LQPRRFFSSQSRLGIQEEGQGFDYRAFLTRDGNKISPWHDLELFVHGEDVDQFFGYFEIQRYTALRSIL